eukprot:CAMPEP_0185533770 /NCGR_PEP_ID=MMETSP1366-20130426/108611_1 /TAXON_ID=38817 /ORGANISM="Gephyrocapsa oceanica, Strain RCC1303" /LENGTH=704 /DNA_ID=CAMNT_0028145495 /DNA_START=1 /DNA_END=2113 /DNA_ORIENTATION=-
MPSTSSRRGLGGIDAQNCRARRADTGLLLRRSKRELDLRRRRSGSGGPSSLLDDPRALEGEEASPRWDEMGVAEQVAQCAIHTIDYVRHGRHEERVSGSVAATERCVGCVRRLRRLLTAPEEAPIDAVIQAGLVPALVELLALPPPECSSDARPLLLALNLESSHALASVTAGTPRQGSSDARPLLLALNLESSHALASVTAGTPRQVRSAVESGVLPRVLELLRGGAGMQQHHQQQHHLQQQHWWCASHALCCVSNLAAAGSEYRDALLGGGALPLVSRLAAVLLAESGACWGGGDGPGPSLVDPVAAGGAAARGATAAGWCSLEHVSGGGSSGGPSSEALADTGWQSALRGCAASLAGLTGGAPPPASGLLLEAMPALMRLVASRDAEARALSCLGLAHVAEAGRPLAVAMAASGCAARLAHCLEYGGAEAEALALRALAALLSGSCESARAVLDSGLARLLPPLLERPSAATRGEACGAVASLAAGAPSRVEWLMGTPLVSLVVQRLAVDEFGVKRQALGVVANVLQAFQADPRPSTAGWAAALVYEHGAVSPLVALLDLHDADVLRVALDASGGVLAAGEQLARSSRGGVCSNPFTLPFAEAFGVEKLEKLQQHPNPAVGRRAAALLDRYFGGVGDAMDASEDVAAADGCAFTGGGEGREARAVYVFEAPARVAGRLGAPYFMCTTLYDFPTGCMALSRP